MGPIGPSERGPTRRAPARVALGCLVLAAILGAVPGALAAGPAIPPLSESLGNGWRWVSFTIGSGLPSNRVAGIVETPDGLVWARTFAGAAWYDGYRWTAVGPERGLPAVLGTAIVPLGDREVVVVAEGRLYRGDRTRFTEVPGAAAGRPWQLRAAARHPVGQGRVLLLDEGGTLYDYDGRTIAPAAPGFTPRGPVITSLVDIGPGHLIATADDGLFEWKDGAWQMRLAAGGNGVRVRSAAVCSGRQILASAAVPGVADGLFTIDGDGRVARRDLPVDRSVEAMSCGGEGEIIVSFDSGDLFVLEATGWRPVQPLPEPMLNLLFMQIRPNGDLWVGGDQGLHLCRRSSSRWQPLESPPGTFGATVNDLARLGDGTLAAATGDGVSLLAEGRLIEHTTAIAGRSLREPTGLAEDPDGRLWVVSGGQFRGAAVRHEGQWSWFSGDTRFEAANLHRVRPDRRGRLWFVGWFDPARRAGGGGLSGPVAFTLDGSGPRLFEPSRTLPASRIYAVAESADGAIWFGSDGGLHRWKDAEWTHWTVDDGLKLARAFSIVIDGFDRVWFVDQNNGVGRLEAGRISYDSAEDGLVSDATWELAIDANQRLWVSTHGGLCGRVTGDWWTCFDRGSGLENTRLWPVLPLGDRVLVGTTGSGVAVLDLAETRNPAARIYAEPPIVEQRSALVQWTVASYWGQTPDSTVEVRYRLDGEAWSPWRRTREARFAALALGRHELTLQAKGLFPRADEPGTSVQFVIDAPIYQRPAFVVPVAVLGLMVIGIGLASSIDRRRHEVATRASEERFRRAFLASPMATSITAAADGRILDVNSALERLTGYARDELIGRTFSEFDLVLRPFTRAELVDVLRRHRGLLPGLESRIRTHAGVEVDVIASLQEIELAGHQVVLTQMVDLTEHKRLEAQLRQAQKMEGVGRLAGGVAHDFNNLLTVILGNIELLETQLPLDSPNRAELEQVRAAANRAVRLTRQLLAFARRQIIEPRVLSINEVVLNFERMLRRLIGEDIEMVTLPAPDLWPVRADPGQLEQVLVNLAVNARDAMPLGGTLTIQTANVEMGPEAARDMADLAAGPYIKLTVSDTGVGMDPATLGHVFEPFFTTKEPGKGTGLGLATCYGIIKQNGGHIAVRSVVGRGTAFDIFLPKALGPDTLADVSEPAESQAREAAGRERILLIEDEPQVRRLASTALRGRGYEVVEAATGSEGLEAAARRDAPFDLLVTDLVMPKMSGAEVARLLRAGQPGLGVLFVSGYSDNPEFREAVAAERTAFLPKPFTPHQLARKVRELLDETGSPA